MATIIIILACICFFMVIIDSVCKLLAIITAIFYFPARWLWHKIHTGIDHKNQNDTAEADNRRLERIKHLDAMLNH